MNRTELINKIKSLDGLDNATKSALIELCNERKRYGLVWEDKPEDVEERLREELPVLREVKDRAIISDNPDAPNHILIEGDNLEALTTLAYTHAGTIDFIYIDPPYNTGNQDFIYNDAYVDREDGYRHSKWLSFMQRRLRIAHKLLSDRGVICMSIDDNEQAQLKLLCDEIFGNSNFVGTYFWKRTSTPPALSYKIRRKLEFVLCYQKREIPQRTYAQGYVDGGDAPLLNTGNPVGTLTFPVGSVHFNIPDGTYRHSSDKKIQLLDPVIVTNGLNENAFRASAHFKWGQYNLDREVSDGTYFIIKTTKFSPRFQKAVKATKVPSNILDQDVLVGTNEDAQKEVSDIGVAFDYAKPTTLISFLAKMPFWEDRNITILDFFAGSGTTLQAVMQLNAEDGGTRKGIIITNNENRICEDVTYERNKRVILGYSTPRGEEIDGLTDNNLRYYQTDFISRDQTNRNLRELVYASTDLLCIKNDNYTEVPMLGRRLNKKYCRYFDNGKGRVLVIYDERAIPDLVEIIKEMPVKPKMKVYVFSYNEYAYDDDFINVADKVELCALPDAILKAYQKVLPKRKTKYLPEAAIEETVTETTVSQASLDFDEEGDAE